MLIPRRERLSRQRLGVPGVQLWRSRRMSSILAALVFGPEEKTQKELPEWG